MIADRACRAVAFLAALGVPAAGQAHIAVNSRKQNFHVREGQTLPHIRRSTT